ncbi:putative Separase [Hibiscus syriacus]|uniref:Separase n=1 Tax=Hibiscus syriacus TaxID=106335 RepID=A0A6A3APS2_HIBSY|nr:putative Separase [Hibiscus syriacus]
MAKGSKGQRRTAFRQIRATPYPLSSHRRGIYGDLYHKKCSKPLDKKDWEDVTCSVCMECPHNAVLLLCSSHDRGCRPYMCGTSFRYSNCLDQGQVKGWTVVEPAREYLNAKRRSCMQDDCTFVGTFKEIRKHMKADHPCARPREVDPTLEQKWRRLEREREREDVISTIRSAMPGAVVFGDYVIEGNHRHFETDEEDGLDADPAERNGSFEVGLDSSNFVNFFLLLHAFGPSGNYDLARQPRQPTHAANEDAVDICYTSPVGDPGSSGQDDDEDDGGDTSLVSRLRQHGRLILGRSGRRRRRREATGGQKKFIPKKGGETRKVTHPHSVGKKIR